MQNRGSSKLVRKAEEPQSVDFSPNSIDFYFTLVDSGHARLGQLAWLEEVGDWNVARRNMEVKDFSLCGKRMHSADASSMLPHTATLHVGCYDGDALFIPTP